VCREVVRERGRGRKKQDEMNPGVGTSVRGSSLLNEPCFD